MQTTLPTLTTDRLVLRTFTSQDVNTVHTLLNNWNVASMLSRVPYPYTKEMAQKWVEKRTQDTNDLNRVWDDGDLSYAVTLQSGELIGTVGLICPNDEPDTLMIGYWYGQAYWNRGYATEAAKALIRQAFDVWKVPVLKATHAKDNPASGYVLAKCGFCYTGDNVMTALAREEDEIATKDYLLKREAVCLQPV
ncbi:MAG: GNAT family N-acetyltransferase [Rhodobiaceae bacterium]|nr:GNAT family N-acetyltransferase [Rhodobiaceae bacterium]